MARPISDDEEFTRDWDWYATDEFGAIGHFTTAGFRELPAVVKSDFESAEICARYFDEVHVRCPYAVNDDLESEIGALKDDEERQHYLRSFVQMAARGLFSFDTKPLGGGQGYYYLVASPGNPLRLDELPPEIAKLVSRVRSDRPFESGLRVMENETLNW